MRDLLILVIAQICGIITAYAGTNIEWILGLFLILGLVWAVMNAKKGSFCLMIVGLLMGMTTSWMYQQLDLEVYSNNNYVNKIEGTYTRSLGMTDYFQYHGRIVSVRQRRKKSEDPLQHGEVCSLEGHFHKTPYQLTGVLFECEAAKIEPDPDSFSFLRLFDQWKISVSDRMKASFGAEEGALASSLVLGLKDPLLSERSSTLQFLGIIHILSISGFHVNLLEMLLDRIRLKRISFWLILLYACLIGSVPAWRACLMKGSKTAARMVRRDSDGFNQLLFSCLILLSLRPYLLFDTSFQLTYAATLGLICLNRPLQHLFVWFPQGRVKNGLLLSAAAMIPCIPILSRMSFDINLAMLPANLVLVPVYSIFCILSFLGIPVTLLPFDFPGRLVGIGMSALLRLMNFSEFILSQWLSLRVAWSGAYIFLWLGVFSCLSGRYCISARRRVAALLLFYGLLFVLAFLPGTTKVIFHQAMGQARIVLQKDLRQYEFVTDKMFKERVRERVILVKEPLSAGTILLEPGDVFPQVSADETALVPVTDPSSDIIDEEYLWIFHQWIRLK